MAAHPNLGPERQGAWSLLVVPAIVASWVGMYVHNVGSLPDQTLLSPDTLFPTLAYLVATIGWFTRWRIAAAWSLLVWGCLNLVGGAFLSILPAGLGDPLSHYLLHLLYGLLQVPLLVVLSRYLR